MQTCQGETFAVGPDYLDLSLWCFCSKYLLNTSHWVVGCVLGPLGIKRFQADLVFQKSLHSFEQHREPESFCVYHQSVD